MPDFSPLLGEKGLPPDIRPVEAAFRAVLNRFRETHFFSRSDEETITGAFLGGLTTVFPFCAIFFAGNEPSEPCCWGHFRKTEEGKGSSEAQTGADFALVVYQSKLIARLALFQAKKVELDAGPQSLRMQSAKDAELEKQRPCVQSTTPGILNLIPLSGVPKKTWLMDVHRRPPYTRDNWREAQLLRLSKFAQDLALKASTRADGIINEIDRRLNQTDFSEAQWKKWDVIKTCVALAKKSGSFQSLDWVHYLAYASGDVQMPASTDSTVQTQSEKESVQEIVCVPVCDLHRAHWREQARSKEPFSHNWVDLSEVHCYRFMDILREGIKGKAPFRPSAGWITVDNAILNEFLPELMELTSVYIADDKGGRSGLSPELQNAIAGVTVEPISGLETGATHSAKSQKITRKTI